MISWSSPIKFIKADRGPIRLSKPANIFSFLAIHLLNAGELLSSFTVDSEDWWYCAVSAEDCSVGVIDVAWRHLSFTTSMHFQRRQVMKMMMMRRQMIPTNFRPNSIVSPTGTIGPPELNWVNVDIVFYDGRLKCQSSTDLYSPCTCKLHKSETIGAVFKAQLYTDYIIIVTTVV